MTDIHVPVSQMMDEELRRTGGERNNGSLELLDGQWERDGSALQPPDSDAQSRHSPQEGALGRIRRTVDTSCWMYITYTIQYSNGRLH